MAALFVDLGEMSGEPLQPRATRGRLIANFYFLRDAFPTACRVPSGCVQHQREGRPVTAQRMRHVHLSRGLLLVCLLAAPCSHANEESAMPTRDTSTQPVIVPRWLPSTPIP